MVVTLYSLRYSSLIAPIAQSLTPRSNRMPSPATVAGRSPRAGARFSMEIFATIIEFSDYRARCALRATCLALWEEVQDHWSDYLQRICPQHVRCARSNTEFGAEMGVASLVCRVDITLFTSCSLSLGPLPREKRLQRNAHVPNRREVFQYSACEENGINGPIVRQMKCIRLGLCCWCNSGWCEACGQIFQDRGAMRSEVQIAGLAKDDLPRLVCWQCLQKAFEASEDDDIRPSTMRAFALEYNHALQPELEAFTIAMLDMVGPRSAPEEEEARKALRIFAEALWYKPLFWDVYLRYKRLYDPWIDQLAATNERRARRKQNQKLQA